MVKGPAGVPRPFVSDKREITFVFSRTTQRRGKAMNMVEGAVGMTGDIDQLTPLNTNMFFREGNSFINIEIEEDVVIGKDIEDMRSRMEEMMIQSDLNLGNILAIEVR